MGPAICLLMVIVGVCIDLYFPAGDSNNINWPPGRVASLTAFLIAFVAGGTHISGHAVDDLRNGRVTIDLLMILAAVGAAAIGDWAEGAILLFLFSLSHALEHFVLGRTRRAIRALMQLTPEEAIVLRNGQERTIPVEALNFGDTVIVLPSARIPADGTVTLGRTSVDQSPMTGESMPVEKNVGDPVFAGTLNQQGLIQIEVIRAASESTLARMVKLVEEAQSERAASQQFTDWFGQTYTWVVLAVSLCVLWVGSIILHESFSDAFYRAMTVLVVASPCAVVISIPAAILSAITSAARGGVLFKGGSHLERAALLKVMAFDKTGTLTLGRPRLVDIVPAPGIPELKLLSAGAALEKHSEHPLARAIVEAADERELIVPDAHSVEAIVGHGIIGTWNGQNLRAGKVSWFRDNQITLDEDLLRQVDTLQSAGKTVICVSDESRAWGLLAVADTLRPTASAAVQQLRQLGLSPLVMLSGDHPAVAGRIAGELGIEFQGSLLPEDKLRIIETLRREHGPVGMIGDGMNDAPSLAAADVGFSLGGAGTDVALETADIVLLADDLRRLPYAIALARQTQQIIRQNLALAFSVMGLLLIAATVTRLPLPLAVMGHEGSTVAVILNGLRLLAFPKPKPLAGELLDSGDSNRSDLPG
ncbi:MAG: cadmium-translocating P-type ATPase [Planctomycetes bacterium]|nr:cadmium-translocating P-type ATPase [Planctomycetota bacterium]